MTKAAVENAYNREFPLEGWPSNSREIPNRLIQVEMSTISFREFKESVKNFYSQNDETDDKKYSDWMQSVKATLGILGNRPWDSSIYKVPNKLRRLKEDAYSPYIVSIGPFHINKHELVVAMEEHKWRYMLNFLRRAAPPDEDSEDYSSANEDVVTSTPDQDSVARSRTNNAVVTSRSEEANHQRNEPPSVKALEKCGKAVSKLEQAARACYAETIDLEKHQLAEILLVDGCFMLELFIKHAEQDKELDEDTNQPHQEVDPIINNSWMVPTLQRDLALLENQIPFVVLHILFHTIQKLANKQFRFSLDEYVLLFFRSALNLSDKAIHDKRTRTSKHKHKHIADLLHRVVYKPTLIPSPKRILQGREKIEWGFKRCATQLVESGIRFQPGDDKDRRLLDITFNRGVIAIPPLNTHEITDSVFRNLIAFEQCSFGSSHHMASYVWLMKTLIRSSQDAKLLRLKGIITNQVRGDEEVSTFFENLCREVVFKDFYFGDLCEEVNRYNKTWLHWGRIKAAAKVRCNGYIVTLKNDYFNSPWTVISFLAASVLLCLTALQTYYTVRSYYPH